MDLESRVNRIAETFGEDYFTKEFSKEDIIDYFKKSRLAYKLFQSATGSMHFELDFGDGDKVYSQANLVRAMVRPETRDILEIGSGNDTNLEYLAQVFRDKNFYGIDITKGNKVTNLNITTQYGDYHDMSMFEDNSMDIVYAVETMCYATDIQKVLSEISRILRPSGKVIIFDGYMGKCFTELTPIERKAVNLTDSGMAVNSFRHHQDIEDVFSNFSSEVFKFVPIQSIDLSAEISKNWDKFDRLSSKFLNNKLACKVGKVILPKEVLGNIITGNLGGKLFKDGVYTYYMHAYKKLG